MSGMAASETIQDGADAIGRSEPGVAGYSAHTTE